MKLAIHHRLGSFSDRWLEYCKENQINFKLVDCTSSGIVEELRDCDGLLWHWDQTDAQATLFARQLIYAIEAMKKPVFPNSKTCWLFNDKVGQKYLLESLNAPLINSWVYYDKKKALKWAKTTDYPKVFKLRGGAGSNNVLLLKSFKDAKKYIGKMFGSGLSPIMRGAHWKECLRLLKSEKTSFNFLNLCKATIRLFFPNRFERTQGADRGYIYIQEFVPCLDHDIRLVVIGKRAFGLKRMVRKGDFRASGSGVFYYDKKFFSPELVRKAFDIADKLKMQSCALDFLGSEKNSYKLVEISYGFSPQAYKACPGYWDIDLNWHNNDVIPEDMILEDFLSSLNLNMIE